MKIGYASGKLEKICTVKRMASKEYDQAVVVRLFQHLGLLAAYNHLGEIGHRTSPLGFHPLSANYAGCFAIKVTGKLRVVFKPAGSVTYLNANDVDLNSVTEVEVVAIEDYHQ